MTDAAQQRSMEYEQYDDDMTRSRTDRDGGVVSGRRRAAGAQGCAVAQGPGQAAAVPGPYPYSALLL